MEEDENWQVVNSKSRSKKSTAPVDRSSEEVSSYKPRNLRGRFQQGHQYKNESAGGRRDEVPSGADKSQPQPRKKFIGKPTATNESNRSLISQSNTKGGPSTATAGPSQPIRLLKRATVSDKANSNDAPAASQTLQKEQNGNPHNNQAGNRAPPSHPSCITSSTTEKTVPATENTQKQDEPQCQHDKPSNSSSPPKQGPSGSGSEPIPKEKKRKKRDTKEVRRKKREEKFYQALYHNKDSHIQFVSADVIRQMKNDSDSSSKFMTKNRNRTAAVSLAGLSTNLQNLSISESEPFQSFGDFPTLTPCGSSIANVPGPSYRFAASPSNTPTTPVPNIKIEKTKVSIEQFRTPPQPVPELSLSSPKSTPVSSAGKGKKSKQPLVIDVSELILKKKERNSDKRNSPAVNNTFTPNLKQNHKLTAGNPLDSSGPGVIHRGKIREKKKKPTKLKLTILKSRAFRKMLLEMKVKQEGESSSATAATAIEVAKPSKEDEENIIIKVEPIENPLSESTPIVTTEPVNIPTSETDSTSTGQDSTSPLPCLLDSIKTEPTVVPEAAEEKHFVDDDKNVIPAIHDIPSLPPPPSDFQTKFFKLLDEVAMLKIVEDTSVPPDIETVVKNSMHNRKFRDYCDMYTSKELHKLVTDLLSELFRFQDRLYHTDPIKFKTKRRFVTGLKEAVSYLNLNKVQLLIIAPNIEKNPEPGGLDDKMKQVLSLARGNNVPYVFSGNKYTLGKAIRIKTPISIISILDKQNCEEMFRKLLSEATLLRERYQNDFIARVKENMKSET